MAISTRKTFGKYKVQEVIGKGTFGKVYIVKSQTSTEQLALKRISLQLCSSKDKAHALGEMEIMKGFDHDNLVKYHDSFQEDNHIHIVMEYCSGGNLQEYVRAKERTIDEAECINKMIQICQGLQYLHDKNIAHRDVKLTNIYIANDRGLKIGDFGVAKVVESERNLTKNVGTPFYMSPEMLNGKPYNIATDVWSLGCCLSELCTKKFAFTAENMKKLRECVSKSTRSQLTGYSREMNELFVNMIQVEPSKRPSIDDVYRALHEIQLSNESQISAASERRPRRRHNEFSKTCPSNMSYATGTSSGYDSSASSVCGEGSIVNIPVILTDEEKDAFEEVNRLKEKISKRMGGKRNVMDKISNEINKTKSMDDDRAFMINMESVFNDAFPGSDKFRLSKKDLQCLWIYQKDLLKKQFKMALPP